MATKPRGRPKKIELTPAVRIFPPSIEDQILLQLSAINKTLEEIKEILDNMWRGRRA